MVYYIISLYFWSVFQDGVYCTMQISSVSLEWRQPERIPSVLDSEDSHQEAIHTKQHSGPDNDCHLLGPGVFDAGDTKGQVDCAKCKKGIWNWVSKDYRGLGEYQLTHASHNLSLHSKLVLEASSKI